MYLFCLCFVRAITCYTRVYVRGCNSVSIFTSRLTNTQHNTQHITWSNVWSELPNFIDLIELFECAVFHFDFCVNQTVLAWSWNNTCDMLETTAISRGATTGNNCRIIALLPAITITSRRQLTWGPQHRISSTSVLYATSTPFIILLVIIIIDPVIVSDSPGIPERKFSSTHLRGLTSTRLVWINRLPA